MSIQHRFYYKTARREWSVVVSRFCWKKCARALVCEWTTSFQVLQCPFHLSSAPVNPYLYTWVNCRNALKNVVFEIYGVRKFFIWFLNEGRKLLNSPDNFEKLSIPHQFSFIYSRHRDTINGREKMTFAGRQWFYLILKKLSISHQSFLFWWPLT